METPDKQLFADALVRVRPFVHRTPVMTSSTLNDLLGGQFYFKCENLQKIGAFKFRGAINKVYSLPSGALVNGVATASSGNHAQAVALAARMKGIPSYIVMPENAPSVKVAAVKGYGAQITLCKPTLKDRYETLERMIAETGAALIHAFDDPYIIAGQGTATMELVEEVPGLDLVLAPVGGGGLIGGTALAAHYFSPGTQVWGCEPTMANDAYKSYYSKTLVPSNDPQTLADGLLTSLGKINFPILLEYVSGVATASEKAIADAMFFLWERMKLVVEPSGAVPLACLMEGNPDVKGKKVGIILSGGNVDLRALPWMKAVN